MRANESDWPDEGSDESFLQQRQMQQALLAQGVGVLHTIKFDPEESCAVMRGGISTCVLSSDMRCTSAMHAVVGRWAPEDHQLSGPLDDTWDVNDHFRAAGRLGGVDSRTGLQVRFGDFQPAFWVEDVRDDEDYPFDAEPFMGQEQSEENPLLALRLFQLGMREWTQSAVGKDPVSPGVNDGFDIRRRLSVWDFEPDGPVPGGNTFLDQGIATLGRDAQGQLTSVDGRDIAVLRARQKNESIFWEVAGKPVRSGPFPIDQPAVFFNVTPFSDQSLEANDALSAIYASFFPTNSVPGDAESRRALINYRGRGLGNHRVDRVPSCAGEGHAITLRYNDRVETTLDSAPGTSGGAVLLPQSGSMADGVDRFFARRLFASGILNGASVGTSGDFSNPGTTWGAPVEGAGNATLVTQVMSADLQVITAPLFRMPVSHPDDRAPGCGGIYESGSECVDVPDLPDDLIHLRPETFSEDDTSSARAGPGARFVRCSFDADGSPQSSDSQLPGVMVGVLGGRLRDSGDVGTFMPVCAPWTNLPYTSNWRFLYVKGARLRHGVDNVRGNWGFKHLMTVLRENYELRQTDAGLRARPVSMQLCPPNFFVNRIAFYHDRDLVRSIESITCQRRVGEEFEKITLFLDDEDEGFTFNGEPFSLRPEIGTYRKDITNVLFCEKGQVMTGVYTNHREPDSAMTYLASTCMAAP